MPRNASGVYSLPQSPFTPSTTIQSSPVNSNFSDIASAITQSLATTGVSSMVGPIKAASGTVAAPGITFGSALGTGFFLSAANEISWAANGVLAATFFADTGVEWFGTIEFISFSHFRDFVQFHAGVQFNSFVTFTEDVAFTSSATINGRNIDAFPAGTVMMFRQTTAPTGWTKVTTNVDGRALRVTSGTISQGGSISFLTLFESSYPSQGFTLTTTEMPVHGHAYNVVGAGDDDNDAVGGFMLGDDVATFVKGPFTGSPPTNADGQAIGGAGSGGSHSHDVNLEVLYLDVIIATKD